MAGDSISALFDGAQGSAVSCEGCGSEILDRKPRQRLCSSCSKQRNRERCRIRNNKGVVGSLMLCVGCGEDVQMTGSRQKFCPPCADAARLAAKTNSGRRGRKKSRLGRFGHRLDMSRMCSSVRKISDDAKILLRRMQAAGAQSWEADSFVRWLRVSVSEDVRQTVFLRTMRQEESSTKKGRE